MIITAILVIGIFSLLVFVHELGHFIMARRNGVRVDEFGFGFPPQLLGKKVGETVYSINAIPLGGFVRLSGEDSADRAPNTFGAASVWIKTKIMLAGVVMNTLLAYVLLLVLCLAGLPSAFSNGFNLPKPAAASSKQLLVLEAGKGTPAAEAGIVKGDIILTANGQPLVNETDLTSFTKNHASQEVVFEIKHNGTARTVKLKLRGKEAGRKNGYLGVAPLQVYSTRFGLNSLWVAAWLTAQMLWLTLVGILQLFVNLPALVGGVFQSGVPQAAQSVAGPIGIFTALGNIKSLGWTYLVFFVTTISIALAVFNLLPIPVLDGGKLFLIWLQKLLKRTFSPETEAKVYLWSMIVLGIFVLMVSVFDIRRL